MVVQILRATTLDSRVTLFRRTVGGHSLREEEKTCFYFLL